MKNITIFGNVTKDAELRRTQGGQEICSFSVAVNDRRSDATMYFDCSYWGKSGSAVQPYINKGGQVCVSGELSQREYNGKTYLQVDVSSLKLASGRKKSDGRGADQSPDHDASGGMMEDEIPF